MITKIPFAASTIGSYWWEAGKRLGIGLARRGYELTLKSRTMDSLNALSVGRRESLLGISSERFIDWAQRRVGPYAGQDLADLRVIGALNNPQWIVAAVDRASGITSLAELGQKRYPWKVVLPLPDHAASVYVDRLLELHGITRAKIIEWGGEIFHPQDTRPRTEAPDQPWVMRSITRELAEKKLATGYMNYTRWTNVWTRDLMTFIDFRFLRFEPDLLTQVMSELGGSELTLPAGLHRGIDEDMPVMGWRYDYVYGTSETPDALVRAVLGALEDESFLENAVGYSYCGCRPRSLPPSLRYHPTSEAQFVAAK
jgi:hypothetical protein